MNHPRRDYSYAPPPNYSAMPGRGDRSRKRRSFDFEEEQRQMKFSRPNNDINEAQRHLQFAHPAFSAPPVNRIPREESKGLQNESRKYIDEMQEEITILERSRSPEIQYLTHSRRLLNEESKKISENCNPDWIDLSNSAPFVKVVKCVLLPKARPGLNVVGRLFGMGGATLKKVCQLYKCRISISGAGSRKDPEEEHRLLESGDPNFSHLNCPLHAEIFSAGPAHLAHTRLANLLTLFHKLIYVKEKFEQDGIVFEESKTATANPHEDQKPTDFSKHEGRNVNQQDQRQPT